jgi:hypothetical protein
LKTKVKRIAGTRIALCLVGLFFTAISQAQLTVVLVSNYDAKLLVAGESHHITNQVRVRNGRTFPIEFQEHRIDVSIVSIGDGKYRATLNVFDRKESRWSEITTDDLTFEALFAAPVVYQWKSGDVSLDLGIAVSIFHR